MDAKQIEKIILKSTGDPTVGPIRDNAALIAEAIYRELSGESSRKPKQETRLMPKPEIPAAEQ